MVVRKTLLMAIYLETALVHVVLIGTNFGLGYFGFFCFLRCALAKVKVHRRDTSECFSCVFRGKGYVVSLLSERPNEMKW